MSEFAVLRAYRLNKVLPPGYRVDHDPHVVILRRSDGSVVGYFPVWSMDPATIVAEAEADMAQAYLSDW